MVILYVENSLKSFRKKWFLNDFKKVRKEMFQKWILNGFHFDKGFLQIKTMLTRNQIRGFCVPLPSENLYRRLGFIKTSYRDKRTPREDRTGLIQKRHYRNGHQISRKGVLRVSQAIQSHGSITS